MKKRPSQSPHDNMTSDAHRDHQKQRDPQNASTTAGQESFHSPFRQQLKSVTLKKAAPATAPSSNKATAGNGIGRASHVAASAHAETGRGAAKKVAGASGAGNSSAHAQKKKAAAAADDDPFKLRDEQNAFLSAMVGVKPLGAQSARVAPVPEAASTASASARQTSNEDALALVELQELVDGQGPFRLVTGNRYTTDANSQHANARVADVNDDDDVGCTSPHSGAAPGVNNALLSQLQHGGFAYHRTLDLHGLTRDAAQAAVSRFVGDARRGEERCVLIITGRGQKSPGGISVLREALPMWLSRPPISAHVLAFATALPEDGGAGAFYVLLRRAATTSTSSSASTSSPRTTEQHHRSGRTR